MRVATFYDLPGIPVNTVIVSGILSLLEGKGLGAVWESWYLWSFTYYLVGSALLGLVTSSTRTAEGWLMLVPLVYLVHFYYGLSVHAPGAEDSKLEAETPSRRLPRAARVQIAAVTMSGFSLLVWSMLNWTSASGLRFACILTLAAVAAACKIKLPKMTGTMSVLFVILLFGVTQMSLSEMLMIAAFSAAVQSLWRAKTRPVLARVLFNVAVLVLSTATAIGAFRITEPLLGVQALSVALLSATVALYVVNTTLEAVVLGLIDGKPLSAFWQNCWFWSLPYTWSVLP